MKKILLATVLILNFSTAYAFDWMKYSKEVNVGNEYTAVISLKKYGARWEADAHCRALGHQVGLKMRLADFDEVLKIAGFGTTRPTDMMVQIKSPGKPDRIAIMAWDNKPIKSDVKDPSNKDTSIVYQYRAGNRDVLKTNLKEIAKKSEEKDETKKETVVDYQDQPIKDLPAICVHDNKK